MTPGSIVRCGERFAAVLFVVRGSAVLAPIMSGHGVDHPRRGDVPIRAMLPVRHPVARCGEPFVVPAGADMPQIGMVPDLRRLQDAARRAAETAGIEAKFARVAA